ncbi:MAG: hypothetical protein WCW36_01550 [Candidatus Paceibacterota bacterium]|jgi:hypothetical protein
MIVVLLGILSGVAVSSAAEGDLELGFKVDDGQLMISIINWDKSGYTVTPRAEKHHYAVRDVYISGGTVAVQTELVPKVVDMFHYQKDTVQTLGVKLYPGYLIDVTDEHELVELGEPEFFWFPIFCVIAIVSLIVLSMRKNFSSSLAIIAFVCTMSAFAAMADVASESATLCAMFATLLIVVLAINNGKDKVNTILSKCVCMASTLLLAVAAMLTYFPLSF